MNSDIKLGLLLSSVSLWFLFKTIKDLKKGEVVDRSHGGSRTVATKENQPHAFYITIILHITFQLILMIIGLSFIISGIKK